MDPIARNILAVIAGAVVGSIVNGAIIGISGSIIPAPAGADLTTMEGLRASMHLFGPENFIMPFLAHALGTLVGAFIAALIAANHRMKFAIAIGVLFLIGGIANAFLLPAPAWYIAVDLLFAYIPMGYLGGMLAIRSKRNAIN